MIRCLRIKTTIFILLGLLMIPFFVNAAYPAPEATAEDAQAAETVQNLGDEAISQIVNLYFFYSETCPRCHEEALWLSKLQQAYGDKIKVYAFEVTTNKANLELFKKFGQQFEVDISSVPLLFIGERYMIGYQNDEYTGAEIQNLVDQYLKLGYHDLGRHILFPDEECDYEKDKECPENEQSKIVKVPLIGEINLQNTSLFITTLVLGGLDGFNPCAMWVLIFLISLLLGIDSSRRRWILGITFIAGSALVYYLFMAAWLNIFLFIGYLLMVRIIVGGLAIAFGVYNLRQGIMWTATCQVTQSKSRQKVLEKIKNTALQSNLWLAMVGIIFLAFTVNLIELACSAGFPAVYTQLLAARNLPAIVYYLYLLLYIFIFMLDDIIVFIVAMVTLKLTGVDAKYSRYSNLIGGLIILILGVLLIFKPNWLTF